MRCLTFVLALALLAIPTMARAQSGSDGKKGNKNGERAAGPCFDNTNRYVNCNNGTVTDTVTGLIWLQQVDCISPRDYAAANNAAALLATGQCGLATIRWWVIGDCPRLMSGGRRPDTSAALTLR